MSRNHNIVFLVAVMLIFGITTTVAQSFDPELFIPKSKIKVLGNVFGGGDQAAVQGNTEVEINRGQFAGEIFGGGNGALYDGTDGVHEAGTVKASADIGMHNDDGSLVDSTGMTTVTINGGEMFFDDDFPSNHNIYGGGNLACNVADRTHVVMKKSMVTWYTFLSNPTAALPAWYTWYDQAMNPNTQKTPIVAVFGAGYGAHTDVADSTSITIDFDIDEAQEIKPADGVSFTHEELETIDQTIMRWMPDHRLVEQFVSAVHGGGYDGTVGAYDAETYAANPTTGGINYDKTTYTAQSNVTILGQPFVFHVYGGGLGSKVGADATGGVNSHVGTVYGATKVDIQGGIINGDVFGGGAGIAGQAEIPNPFPGAMGGETVKLPYTYAAQVMRETDVTISGNTTVIFGNVYGGGDIANTGWHVGNSRPQMSDHVAQPIQTIAYLDYTTMLKLNGGNILGSVFGGGNGRKRTEIEQYRFIGSVIGSTNVSVNGSTVWGDIYGGGNTGCVYSCQTIAATQGAVGRPMVEVDGLTVSDGCTYVEVLSGKVARDIFGGGFGDDPTGFEEQISSADISGNTYVHFEHADLEYQKYWKRREIATNETMGSWSNPTAEVTGQFLDQKSGYDEEHGIDYRNSESDICHNLYGGGNAACTVQGHTHVMMHGAPIAPADFSESDYYKECIANVAMPHFSAFGGGFGAFAKVTNNAYSDINLSVGTGLHSIVGGGMNGPVGGLCQVHVGSNPMSLIHFVYGGGYYAPCGSTLLNITSGTILENVFGGAVMGNINEGGAATDMATRTIIGLQTPGEGRYSSVVLKDENDQVLTEYTYAEKQNRIRIGGDVYGANDVSGTVMGKSGLTIYGGTIGGNVYGAGNGNHVGYYVPNVLKYDLGRHFSNYFYVDHHAPGAAGNTYVGRPQTIGGVELTLEGNSEDERVKVLGQVFGGGNSCTIGAWDTDMLAPEGKYHGDPHLTRDDPEYFQGGGTLDINLRSHVTIGRTHKQLAEDPDGDTYIDHGENVTGLFMGCSGRYLATQTGEYRKDNYYHHYFDAHSQQYYPGFAVDDEAGHPMDRETQLKPYQAYMNNIMVWTDSVRLNIPDDAEDIWLSNFVGGGFRGSMRTKTSTGKFDYALTEGVTIGHTVVAGAYNAHIQYHYFDTDADGHFIDSNDDGVYDYATRIPAGWVEGVDYVRVEYTDDEHIKSIIRYNYNGGMLSENSTGVNSSEVGHHIHKVHADPREEGISATERNRRYATSYFEPLNAGDPDAEDEATREKLYTANKDKVLVHLALRCALEPEVLLDDTAGTYVHGGNVFGGCFLSGFVEGDSWVDYNSWLSPNCTDPRYFSKDNNWTIYRDAMDIERNNALSVYGAGYGEDTHSMGDVYLYIKDVNQTPGGDDDKNGHYPYMYNAFGGSNMGTVDGNVNVYYAVGRQGTLLGSLYGGGYKGDIHGNTFVELAEGFVNNVYGGSRQANIDGAAHVWAYDGQARGITDANHLIICNLYGGNDIAGTIRGTMPASFTEAKWTNTREPMAGHMFNTYVEISADDDSADRGFPLVGSAFAGGNGEAWVSEEESGAKPNVGRALIEIDGGSTLRGFGGGNMATVTDSTFIFTDAKSTHFADVTFTEYQKQIVQNIFFRDVTVGYTWDGDRLTMDPFHVARLFGGNNLATMDIQPIWNLKNGRLNNVYSGGNMGDMTYYNPLGKPATQHGHIGESAGVEDNADGTNANYTPRGLSITIDQPNIYIGSLFGGCRLSDVKPDDTKPEGYEGEWPSWPTGEDGQDFYGATVNILDGYIENVYGGNDISGDVYHGTNVNISGAVSGNVYGSGNGFYLYKWDNELDWDDPTVNPYQTDVIEEYDNEHKELIYHVKPMDGFGGTSADDTQKMLTINSYRPSVEKAFLNIAGMEHYPVSDPSNPKRVAYVKGNVFCGGNASTITGSESFTKFKIGSYVTLNGVFMGSDGKAYTEQSHIEKFAALNNFTDMGAATNPAAFPDYDGAKSEDQSHNPILLNVYMMAVDMRAQPKDFNLNLPLKEAHIGTYCGGGNRGSMLVDKTVELPFHHDIIIYDKIVGACLDANVKYNQAGTTIISYGGYTRSIADKSTYGNTKMRLNIASQFVPLVMDVPANKDTVNAHGENFATAAAHDFLYDNRTAGVKYTYEEFNYLFETTYPDQASFEAGESEDHIWKEAPGIYAPSCNIYGGCYQSGEVEGDIELNLHSNMLRYVNKEDLDKSLAQNIACFNVYGAGFGQDSHVWGNVHINMDRSLNTATMGDPIAKSTLSDELTDILTKGQTPFVVFNIEGGSLNTKYGSRTPNSYDCSYPSFNNVIGGGRNGKLIGNSTIEIRNGLVYSDVAGGCYASDMYGSSQVIVGYPKYYRCLHSGEYPLTRADRWNTSKEDFYGNSVIKQSVRYLKGDLVPDNIYQQIVDHNSGAASSFAEVNVDPTTYHTSDGTNWNDVLIKIGKGVYGGGYSLANSAAASAGSITTHKLSDRQDPGVLHPYNFDGRYGIDDMPSTRGYAGNSAIMLGDQDGGTVDHIRISTLQATPVTIPAGSSVIGKFIRESDGRYTHQGDGAPLPGVQYYSLSGDGGIYGDGHLTFCEGFRSADVTRYGWAEGTAKHPILMNTFQRMDLLSVNDCCLMLQGAQDFATDQIDATVYSITRINEMRLNSSLDADATLGLISAVTGDGEGPGFDTKQQRNYLAFFNNVHYLGAIATNDAFESKFHKNDGTILSADTTYLTKKQKFIEIYDESAKDAAATTAFKKRNVGTARNAIGINNGYCLRIQNQEYVGSGEARSSTQYYGPIVGVCEVKLLTLVQGEGGGYVYADNIHEYPNPTDGKDHFLMSSGNFVFPGIIHGDPLIGDQYIVDDCFLKHFGKSSDITTRVGELDEAHYWYVEGNKYFYNTTLTGFTYQKDLVFDLIKTDPNILLSGMENGSKLKISKIEWLSQHRADYQCVLENSDTSPEKISDYEFDIEIGGYGTDDWHSDMPRHSAAEGDACFAASSTDIRNDHLPQFNIKLQDKLDNSGDEAYINHLDEPELVKLYFEGRTKDENDNWQNYYYTITLNIIYLQGPTFVGGVNIENCALPGELIQFSSDGLKVKTPELMPVTASAWKIVPLKEIDEHGVWQWDIENGIVIDPARYAEDPESGNVIGTIPAYYKQNEYNIAYIFTAGGYDFPVMPEQSPLIDREKRMIVVHNYHRMKDVQPRDLQIETMPTIPDKESSVDRKLAEAKIYIEDEADLIAFVNYLNMATEANAYNIPKGLTGLDIILQRDIKLTSALPAMTQSFAGTLHGDGYHIDLNGTGSSLFGSNLEGKVYNLGLIGGTISSADTRATNGLVNGTHTINSYEYVAGDDFRYGAMAYTLSHAFNPTTDHTTYYDYVATRYANGDYQYATTDRVWSLRTGAPYYGNVNTRHNMHHTLDSARWDKVAGVYKPLYDGTLLIDNDTVWNAAGTESTIYRGMPVGYADDYLFFGQHLDKTNADTIPMHIEAVATGDANPAKGGNRVYKADGYYRSKDAAPHYYNKDAWALHPELTAVNYADATDEDDGANTAPKFFSVDSNSDYDEDGNPTSDYTNEGAGHVTQNLLVYNAGPETAFQAYNTAATEADVRYHNIVDDGAGNFATDYLLLVDKQDFNAPIAFAVSDSAVYTRTPMGYSTYGGNREWEGIALPFTVTRMSAEKHGHITHFYVDGAAPYASDEETAQGVGYSGHEYWLRGLVEGDEGALSFALPRKDGYTGSAKYFEPTSPVYMNYTYGPNSWYAETYPNYSPVHSIYNETRTFAGYPLLVGSTPYIIRVPGPDYREFDMSGTSPEPGEYIHAANRKEDRALGTSIAIPVTDDMPPVTTVTGDRSHVGTYLHTDAHAAHAYTIYNEETRSTFTAAALGEIVEPFRTYMTASVSPASGRLIIHEEANDDPQYDDRGDIRPDEPGTPERRDPADITIWYAEGQLYILATTPGRVSTYTAHGQNLATFEVKEGLTVRSFSAPAGIYLANSTKFRVN